MQRSSLLIWCLSFLLGGMMLGCRDQSLSDSAGPGKTTPPEWQKDSFEIEFPPYVPVATVDSFRGQAYLTYEVDPLKEDIRIFNLDSTNRPHTFASLAVLAKREAKTLAFAMNGGMFQPDRSAQGLMVFEGKTVQPIDTQTSGYGNFYLQPNGIFAIDSKGNGYVIPTQHYDSLARETDICYATQSGPMMVVDSSINPLFTDGSSNLHIRNAVGTTHQGRLVFAISTQPISFFDLSSVMRQKGCTQALYLDGFVSKMYLPPLGVGLLADGEGLGPLIAIFQ